MMTHKLCLAPMLNWTDTHFRYFIRLLSPNCFLYTEMITTGALLHGDASRFLSYHQQEHPIALQVGGSDPEKLARCAQFADEYRYDEINLNVGCPSDRVQSGRFGACLMKEPQRVADCVAAMKRQVQDRVLVSVKCRLGVDDQEEFELLENFVRLLASAGCDHVIVHARKAWLKGLSPKENRDIPPLNYAWVYELKKKFTGLKIIINGGIKTIADVAEHLRYVDGVMIGRPAIENVYFFHELEHALFSVQSKLIGRIELLDAYLPYVEDQLARGVRLSLLARPLITLFNGLSGAREWRRYLSEEMHKEEAGIEVLKKYLK